VLLLALSFVTGGLQREIGMRAADNVMVFKRWGGRREILMCAAVSVMGCTGGGDGGKC